MVHCEREEPRPLNHASFEIRATPPSLLNGFHHGVGDDALCILPNAKILEFAVIGEEVGAGEEAARGESVGAVNTIDEVGVGFMFEGHCCCVRIDNPRFRRGAGACR